MTSEINASWFNAVDALSSLAAVSKDMARDILKTLQPGEAAHFHVTSVARVRDKRAVNITDVTVKLDPPDEEMDNYYTITWEQI